MMDCYAFRCSESAAGYDLNELFRSEVARAPLGWTPAVQQMRRGFQDPSGKFLRFPAPAHWCNMSEMIGPSLLEPDSWALVTFTWFLICVATPGTTSALVDVANAGFSGLLICSTFVFNGPLFEMQFVAKYLERTNPVPHLNIFIGRCKSIDQIKSSTTSASPCCCRRLPCAVSPSP
jgi:hypothetical protein